MTGKAQSDVDAVFAAFGGATELAKAIGAPISTAHTWKQKGRVPRWWHEKIDRAANERGLDVPRLTQEAA